MKRLNVKRDYWALAELTERYDLKKLDSPNLRWALMTGVLRPRIWFNRELPRAVYVDGMLRIDVERKELVEGWMCPLLRYGRQTDNFEMAFPVIGVDPARDVDQPMWALEESLTLSQILMMGVVFEDDLRAAESVDGDPNEKELSTREERTRDRMLVVMAQELYAWKPEDGGKGLSQLVEDAKDALLPVSINSVKHHMQLAWQRSQCRKPARGKPKEPVS